MNVKVITTALQHLVGGAASGREAIIVYQWYSRCVKDPSLEDFESWLSKKISKNKEFSQLVQDWHNFYKSRGA